EQVALGKIEVWFKRTEDIVADRLTKALKGPKHAKFLKLLNLHAVAILVTS
ncbi:hypothetical protein M430DRAFT_103850, partial [Amorphotheca resinae ATCC 22711]